MIILLHVFLWVNVIIISLEYFSRIKSLIKKYSFQRFLILIGKFPLVLPNLQPSSWYKITSFTLPSSTLDVILSLKIFVICFPPHPSGVLITLTYLN